MTPPMKNLASIIAWVLLGGLLVWGYQAATDKRSEKSQARTTASVQRKADTAALLRAGPVTTAWDTPMGQVIELKIPKSELGGLLVEVQRCIVWRGTANDAMHCDAPRVDLQGDMAVDPVDLTDLK